MIFLVQILISKFCPWKLLMKLKKFVNMTLFNYFTFKVIID
ncbi:hypothetical protein BVRB_1g003660 [Beta vulgaris subsp. vulgaris]|nr:hypothetical protein BVRB_1g003660 [Beta vulgaris subsp. vulgaris]